MLKLRNFVLRICLLMTMSGHIHAEINGEHLFLYFINRVLIFPIYFVENQNHYVDDALFVHGILFLIFCLLISFEGFRLVGGKKPNQGRLQVRFDHSSNYQYMCGDAWTVQNSKVVCRQLGYPGLVRDYRTISGVSFVTSSDGDTVSNVASVRCQGSKCVAFKDFRLWCTKLTKGWSCHHLIEKYECYTYILLPFC